MSIPTADEFIDIMKRKKSNTAQPVIKLAAVTALQNGKAVIRFDGEGTPSQKLYPAFKSYSPAAGDRVMLINGVIIGGWKP